ncbi:MAG: hypothetical protein V7L31_10715 [Nostoc sp.]
MAIANGVVEASRTTDTSYSEAASIDDRYPATYLLGYSQQYF